MRHSSRVVNWRASLAQALQTGTNSSRVVLSLWTFILESAGEGLAQEGGGEVVEGSELFR